MQVTFSGEEKNVNIQQKQTISKNPKSFLDIAPIGGHDGFADPAGDAGYHYLHHAKFEVNYGVPLIPFDMLVS